MIEIRSLTVAYGNIVALKDVTLDVGAGEIVSILGPNGAGKSTLIKAVSGQVAPLAGEIRLSGEATTGRSAVDIARSGLAVVPEGRRLFGPMTVRENLELGAFARGRFGRPLGLADDLDYVFGLFPRLGERSKQLASTLSGGEQQMLAIARALMARPRAMVMDEPSIGLAPRIVRDIFRTIRRLKDDGKTILLVEQNAAMALKVADRAYVLELGRVVQSGPTDELGRSETLKSHYLGV